MNEKLKTFFGDTSLNSAIMGSTHGDGKIEWHAFGSAIWGGEGTINADNVFRIWSNTKAITTVAVLQLVEQGKLTLDGSLNELMPEMASIPIINDEGELVKSDATITLKHLLTHTSGFAYDFTSSKLMKFKEEKPTDWPHPDFPRIFEPGEKWFYSTSTMWVGKIVEKISGKDLQTYFEDHIFKQLKMDSTWFNVPEDQQYRIVSWGQRSFPAPYKEYPRIGKPTTDLRGDGGLFSTPNDYCKFLTCLLNEGKYDGGQLLTKATIDLMQEDHLSEHHIMDWEDVPSPVPDFMLGDYPDDKDRWGLAWAIEANPEDKVRPQGAGYWSGIANTYYTIDIKNKTAVLYFSNFFPFNDKEAYNFYRFFEKEVYANVSKKETTN